MALPSLDMSEAQIPVRSLSFFRNHGYEAVVGFDEIVVPGTTSCFRAKTPSWAAWFIITADDCVDKKITAAHALSILHHVIKEQRIAV